jgi:hypothetical protein
MKIRNGFVSNSSTSSFCIYGACIDRDKVDEDAVEKLGLSYHYGDPNNDSDMVYIGRSWSSVKDDETGKAFKESIERLIEQLCGESKECTTYEEAWHDG